MPSLRQVGRFLLWLGEQPYSEVALVTHDKFLRAMLSRKFANAEVVRYTLL